MDDLCSTSGHACGAGQRWTVNSSASKSITTRNLYPGLHKMKESPGLSSRDVVAINIHC